MFGQLVDETTLPVRKRRRPALSCIECRRRKIKCDRNQPCNHCKQTKNASCVYQDLHQVTSNRPVSNSTPLMHQIIKSPNQSAPNRTYQPDFSYQLPSRDSSPQSAPVFLDYPDSERLSNPSTLATSVDSEDNQHGSQGLVDRVRGPHQNLPDAMNATDEEITGSRWQKSLGINFGTFNDVIVEDGPSNARLRTKFFSQSDHTPIKELRGTMSKTRFFGQSHWMNSFAQFHRIFSFKEKTLAQADPSLEEANVEVRQLLEKCKTTARKIKAERSVQWHLNPDFKSYVPPREIADKLVHLYLRTMESTHRILHIPQFLREYEVFWANPEKTSQASAVKIVLVMAIGTCFYQEPGNEDLRADARQWIYSAQSWVSAPFEKGRLNLPGLQIHCLLLLARQINSIGGDVIWVAAGSLLRTAFQMGFHLDPKYFPKMSVLHSELRRRLWATVLEMTIQTSVDCGMPPLITPSDYNTAPPANLNDEDITETTQVLPTPKPPHVFTQSSIQIQLLKSINTRLAASTVINNFHAEPSYDIILSLGSDLSEACKEHCLLLKAYPTSQPNPTALQRSLLDILVRRFLIAIHRPFAVKSASDPRYYFSRKVCAETALTILSHSGIDSSTTTPPVDSAGNVVMEDYTRLCTVAGGLYKEVIIHAGLIAALELITQLEEDVASGLSPSPATSAARQPYRDAVYAMETLITSRVQLGENNVKGLLFMQAAQGQIQALENGEDPDKRIVEAARIGARKCLDLLRARAMGPETPDGAGVEVNGEGNGSQGGEGAWQTDMLDGDPAYGYDFMMQDGSPESGMSNFNFDIPDSWLFSGWGDNTGM